MTYDIKIIKFVLMMKTKEIRNVIRGIILAATDISFQ